MQQSNRLFFSAGTILISVISPTALARQTDYTPPAWLPIHNVKQVDGDTSDPNNEWLTGWDHYLFTLSSSPTGGATWGPAIGLADPTVLWVQTPGQQEGWYYITGTDVSMPNEDIDQKGGNFRIYKSKDLKRFVEHKFAFLESRRQFRVNRIENDTFVYGNLHSPQLFIDPADPATVHLIFTATIGALPTATTPLTYANIIKVPHWDPARTGDPGKNVNPLFPWDEYYELHAGFDENVWWNHNPADTVGGVTLTLSQQEYHSDCTFQSSRYLSIYVASMSVADFVSGDTTKVFATSLGDIRWFGYTGSNSYVKYDGGQLSSPLTYVPTSGFAYGIGIQLLYAHCWYSPTRDEYNPGDPLDPLNPPCSYTSTYFRYPYGMAHRALGGGLWTWPTYMADGGFMFFDTRPGNGGVPWIMYGCRDIGMTSDPIFRGNHVAMARIKEGSDWEAKVGTGFGVKPVHFCENQTVAHMVNGHFDGSLGCGGAVEGSGWSIAESPIAFYEIDRDCYYSMFSRNSWYGPAYNVKYRYHKPDTSHPTFASIAPPTWSPYLSEEMLISTKTYVRATDTVVDNRDKECARSYGTGDMFYLRSSDGGYVLDEYGRKVVMLAYHVKFDGGRSERTVMFKRLPWDAPGSLANVKFKECFENYKCVRQDTWKCQLPGVCRADVTADGIVDFGDYLEFLAFYDALDNAADMNDDCVIDFSDYLEYQNFYEACTD